MTLAPETMERAAQLGTSMGEVPKALQDLEKEVEAFGELYSKYCAKLAFFVVPIESAPAVPSPREQKSPLLEKLEDLREGFSNYRGMFEGLLEQVRS